MAELADALDLGSSTARCAGSTPVPGTIEFSPPPPLLPHHSLIVTVSV